MGNAALFDSSSAFGVTFLFFLFMVCAGIYSSLGPKRSLGIWLLLGGLALELLSTYLGWRSLLVYQKGGFVEGLMFIQLVLSLGAMILLAMAASQILIHNISDIRVILIFGAVGLLAIIYFMFISPDGYMVSSMMQIFPITGFAYIAISFLSQFRQRHKVGFMFAGGVMLLVTFLLVLKLIGVDFSSVWYLAALTYGLLGISLILIKVDTVSKKLDEARLEVEKYDKRIEEIIKSSPFPIVISKLSDDRIILANNNAVKLFGIKADELERYRLKDFFVDADNRMLLNERLEQEREVQDFEILVKTPAGDTPFWLLTSANVIDYNYDVALYAAFQDITSRKNREVLLKNQATRDPLTSLFNRRYFEDEVVKRILASKAAGENFSVLMIDADLFKRVNDTYGHKTGDKVLIELASTCQQALRNDDIVARYGGEEFVIYLAKVNAQKAKVVAERLRESISQVVVYSDENDEVRFTVSIGISSSEVSDNIDTLIKTADEALYKAKQNGRNRVEIFDKDDLAAFDNKEADERLKNETSNRHPIFDKEETEEISLLDGIEANHIQEGQTKIEDEKKLILGVDEEDLA